MPIRAIVFDIGGVLEVSADGRDPAHSFDVLVGGWEKRLDMRPGELAAYLATARADGALGRCSEDEWRARLGVAIRSGDGELDELLADFWELYLGELNDELARFFAGLRPRYRTALLSNSFVGARRRERERYRFDELADLIVYSHEEGVEKPDRRIYELTCERLDVEPEDTIFLDDVEAYAAGAREVGMHAVLYRDTAQAVAEIKALLTDDA